MALEPVFADTSFFFALAAKRDRAHGQALIAYSRLLSAGRRVITSDYVLDETLTLVKLRTRTDVAVALLARIEQSAAIVVEEIGAMRFKAAVAVFRKCADQAYSFTDCSSFALMRELKLKDALTTDRHFAEAGFRALLKTD